MDTSIRIPPLRLPLMLSMFAAALAGCGGGGDDPPPSPSHFAIQGALALGGVPVTICIENAAYTDPSTPDGLAIATKLASYYGVAGGYRAYAGRGPGQSCRDAFPVVDHMLSVEQFGRLPAPAAANPPPPVAEPAPVATPAPAIACGSASGSGIGGLELFGVGTYGALTTAASTTTSIGFDPGEIRYGAPAGSVSGSLRARLWAVDHAWAGGPISGHVVATYDIRFTDGTNQLRAGESSNLTQRTLAAMTPPAGSYCLVTTFEEYDANSCTSADRYCTADWMRFPEAVSFR